MFFKILLLEFFHRRMMSAPYRSRREWFWTVLLHAVVDHCDEAVLHTWMLHERKY